MPEVASLPLHVRLTGRLYHPLKSGARAGVVRTPIGGSASTLIVTGWWTDVPSSLVALQLNATPFVGPGTVIAGAQSDLVRGGLAVTIQRRTTLLPWLLPRHQPLSPRN